MCINRVSFCVFFLCIVLGVTSEATNGTSSRIHGEKATWEVCINIARDAVAKAKNSLAIFPDGKCVQKEPLMSHLQLAYKMIKHSKFHFPTCNDCNTVSQPILDCSDLLRMGHRRSSVYAVSPRRKLTDKASFDVYCDMETDGGGWTVIQRRGVSRNPMDYFYREWISYKEGFGDLEKEFWLGNDKIFALTNQELYSARFDLVDLERKTRYAHYDAFWIDGENTEYTLHISNYSGDAGDSMVYHNNQKFSTKDRDNDDSEENCAEIHKGAWWFNACIHSDLNGENLKGNKHGNNGKIWKTWRGYESLARTEIKIRPKNFRS